MKPGPALEFVVRRSWFGRGMLAALVGLAALSLVLSRVPAFALPLAAAALAAVAWRAYTALAAHDGARVVWLADGTWLLRRGGVERASAQLAGWSRRGPLLVLRLRPQAAGAGTVLLLLPDSLEPDAYRRLRARLLRNEPAPAPA